MRDYAKLSPTFWTGATGKEFRRRGSEGIIVALYLMSSPHSNMLGLYYQPRLYMAHETGLGIDGASKGLRRGFLLKLIRRGEMHRRTLSGIGPVDDLVPAIFH